MSSWEIIEGDCRDVLATLPERSVHTVVTSPPYFGLRDYGTGAWEGGDPGCRHVVGRARQDTERETPGGRGGSFRGGDVLARVECPACGAVRVDQQIGLEPTPDEFVAAMVDVFRAVRRVLRDDGTVWLNLGDSYAGGGAGAPSARSTLRGNGHVGGGPQRSALPSVARGLCGCKPKDLVGIPWMVAFELRADGWYLRSDIVWSKPNPMPESVTDRPTKAHEYLFLLSKEPRYFYDADAIRKPHAPKSLSHRGNGGMGRSDSQDDLGKVASGNLGAMGYVRRPDPRGANKRSVWTVATHPYPGAHFATFPPDLVEPCVLAGAPRGGTVLDPFAGAGTTGLVALRNGRSFVGIELSPEYAAMARDRIDTDQRLGHRPPQTAADQIDGQTSIFDTLADAA